MKKIKNILIPIGNRSEYNLIYPVYKEFEKNGFDVSLLVTGPYPTNQLGHSMDIFSRDKLNVKYKIPVILNKFDQAEMAYNLSTIIKVSTKLLSENKPDLIYIQGDRMEQLGVTLAAAYLEIPLAQAHAGEITSGGHIDDLTRHVITRYASLIFTANKTAEKRVIKMGEEKKRVFSFGAPGLDTILTRKSTPFNELVKKYDIPSDGYGLLVQHSITSEADKASNQIRETINAIEESKMFFLSSYPSPDNGATDIMKELENPILKMIKLYANYPPEDFIGLMKNAKVLVGNSSSGIVEAASYHLPVVNIGNRQLGRDQSGNVINVKNNAEEILKAIKKASSREFKEHCEKIENIYGDGHASEKIVKIISSIDLDSDFLKKKIDL